MISFEEVKTFKVELTLEHLKFLKALLLLDKDLIQGFELERRDLVKFIDTILPSTR
jgi:hypothetical protein